MVEFALAAGALVLSSIAVVVAVWTSRARRTDPVGRLTPSPPPSTAATLAGAATPADGDASWLEFRLSAVEAVARSRTVQEVAHVTGRALRSVAPGATVEVRLGRTRVVDPAVESALGAGCGVPSADACPAVRQASVLAWRDPQSLDACPWFALRDASAGSAVCAPVAVGGRGIGFLHVVAGRVHDAAGPVGNPGVAAAAVVGNVAWLGAQVGALLDTVDAPVDDPSDRVEVDPPSDRVGTRDPIDTGPIVDLTVRRSDNGHADAGRPDTSGAGAGHAEAGGSRAADRFDPLFDPPFDPPVDPPGEVPAVAASDVAPHAGSDPAPDPWPGQPTWSSPAVFSRTLGGLGAPYVLVLGAVDDAAMLAATGAPGALESAVAALAASLSADPDPLGPASLVACSRLDESTIAVAWSGLTLGRSVEVLELVRGELQDEAVDGMLGDVRWSFGLTHSSVSPDPTDVVAVARAGLERAQGLGGDEIVYADRTLLENPPADA